jgi:hypothetical protein
MLSSSYGFYIVLRSSLVLCIFGWMFRIHLGGLIKQVEREVTYSTKDGVRTYKAYFTREYGFQLYSDMLVIRYGIQETDYDDHDFEGKVAIFNLPFHQ